MVFPTQRHHIVGFGKRAALKCWVFEGALPCSLHNTDILMKQFARKSAFVLAMFLGLERLSYFIANSTESIICHVDRFWMSPREGTKTWPPKIWR